MNRNRGTFATLLGAALLAAVPASAAHAHRGQTGHARHRAGQRRPAPCGGDERQTGHEDATRGKLAELNDHWSRPPTAASLGHPRKFILKGDAPATANRSLWRQQMLNMRRACSR